MSADKSSPMMSYPGGTSDGGTSVGTVLTPARKQSTLKTKGMLTTPRRAGAVNIKGMIDKNRLLKQGSLPLVDDISEIRPASKTTRGGKNEG